MAMLRADPTVAATGICQQLRRDGYDGSVDILKRWLREVRPQFVAAAGFQRTSYRYGEICQVDWWHTGVAVSVGKDTSRPAYGLVATLPASAAHAVVFTLSKTTADFCAAFVGCLQRLGGVAEKVVCDNDTSIVASRQGGTVRLHPEVVAVLGALRMRPVVLRPATPTSKVNHPGLVGGSRSWKRGWSHVITRGVTREADDAALQRGREAAGCSGGPSAAPRAGD